MEKKLITEVEKIKKMMGLLLENTGFFNGITDDMVKDIMSISKVRGFKSWFKQKDVNLMKDLEKLEGITSGKIKLDTPADVAAKDGIIKRLIQNEAIADYLIPELLTKHLPTFNNMNLIKDAIKKNIKSGVKPNVILNGIPNIVRVRFPQTDDIVKKYIVNDLKNYTVYITDYIPGSEFLSSKWGKLKQGWSIGKDAKSGGLAGTKSLIVRVPPINFITKASDKYFKTSFRKKLNEEEVEIVRRFFLTGVADYPLLRRVFKSYGFVGATGNLARQLVKKIAYLTLVKSALNFLYQSLVDNKDNLSEYDEENMHWFFVVCYRLVHSIEFPSLGWVSPAGWLAGLLGFTLKPAVYGKGRDAMLKEFENYLKGGNEKNYPKLWHGYKLSDIYQAIMNSINSEIEKIDVEIKQLESGKNIEPQTLSRHGVRINNNSKQKTNDDDAINNTPGWKKK